MNISKTILYQIKQLRLKNRLSQYDIAEKICVSQPVYSKLETGKTALDIDQLIRIAEALGVNFLDLISPDSNKPQLSDQFSTLLNGIQQQQQQQQLEISKQLFLVQQQVSQEIQDLKESIIRTTRDS